jgi:Flp pilus assembly protein TadG
MLLNSSKTRSNSQKGMILVLAAVLMPLIMAFSGLAIDVGSLYVHKARLQNAADAAALAGGSQYASTYNATNDGTKAKQAADTTAQSYFNTTTFFRVDSSNFTLNNDRTCYIVNLTENVPLYFLHYFGITDPTIAAHANVRMATTTTSQQTSLPMFDNLVSAGNSGANFVQVREHDDLNQTNPNNPARKTFNGNLRCANAPSSMHIAGNFIPTTSSNTTNPFLQDPSLQNLYTNDMDTYIKNLVKGMTPLNQNAQQFDTTTMSTITYATNATDIQVHSFPSSNTTKYLIVESQNTVNIHLNSTDMAATGNSLIVIALNADIALNLDGSSNTSSFQGILYSPKHTIQINSNGASFYGNITGNYVDIEGGKGAYTYKKIDGTGSAAPTTTTIYHTKVNIVSDDNI